MKISKGEEYELLNIKFELGIATESELRRFGDLGEELLRELFDERAAQEEECQRMA